MGGDTRGYAAFSIGTTLYPIDSVSAALGLTTLWSAVADSVDTSESLTFGTRSGRLPLPQ